MEFTQEQLAAIIAKIYASLKASKADGDEITEDDISTELSKIIGDEMPAEPAPAPEDEKAAEDNSDIDSALVGKILGVLSGMKSNEPEADTKTEEPAAETKGVVEAKGAKPNMRTPEQPRVASRKYANLFISQTGAERIYGKSEFKTRLASMSKPERDRAVFGAFGRAVKCIYSAHGDSERAAFAAEHRYKDAEMARELKALSATVSEDGGYLIPEIYSNEIIEMLYPSTVIYSLGARRLGMTNGNLNIPKIKSGARATYVGENRAIPSSSPKYGNLKLSAKKLTALVPMSNDLLRSTNFDNDVIVGQDVTTRMALGVDYGALFGTGDEFQPLGITKNKKVLDIDATKIDAEYASAAGVLTAAFPNYIVATVMKNNTYAGGLGFVFNTSVEQFFKSLRDNVGGFIFADEMNKNGTLAGYPYKTTNLIETTGGKTQIIFGNWNDLVIGEQGALEIDVSREATWTNEDGQLVSAYENDQTLIRAINNVDTGLRHEESFAVASKVSVPV